MNKDLPKSNRFLFEKWRKHSLDQHRRTLSNTRPVIKLKEPESLSTHPKGDKKGE